MILRLRAASRTPPDAAVFQAPVQQLARSVVQRQVERGRMPRLSVQTARNRLTVTGTDSAVNQLRRELARERPRLAAAVRADAQRKIGGGR